MSYPESISQELHELRRDHDLSEREQALHTICDLLLQYVEKVEGDLRAHVSDYHSHEV